MGCTLSISGKNFDVDAFIKKTQLRPYQVLYKGQSSRPHRPKLTKSSLSLQPSKADFDDFKKQVSDTILYLKRHKSKLAHIVSTPGIDHAVLDFGIYLRVDRVNYLYQSDYFPSELVKLAGELGLGLMLSIYAPDMNEILAK